MEDQKKIEEIQRKIRENEEAVKALRKAQDEKGEEFNKLQKSDSTFEDLRK